MARRLRKRARVGRFVLLLLVLFVFGGACQQPLVQNPDFTTDFDTEAPGSSSLSGVAATSDPQPTWTWTSGGNGIGYYRYRINGGGWQETTATSYTPESPLPEGVYVFEVSERDDRGNWSESSRFRTAVDLTPPDIPTISVPGSPLLDPNGDPVPDTVITGETQPIWSWQAAGNGSAKFAVDSSGAGGSAPPLEGSGFPPAGYAGVPDTSYQPAAALGTGSFTVRVSERDEAGNWSEWAQFTVVIDLTIPTVTLLDDSGTPGDGITNINPPQFQVSSGTGPTVTDTYRWRVDAGDWNDLSGASPVTFSPPALTDGPHTIEVQQQREDSTYSLSGTATVTIDTTGPNIPVVTTVEPDPTPNFRPTWDWISGGGGGAGVFQYDASGAGGALSGEVGVSSYTPAADLPNNDTYTVSVRERDVAGNWSNWSSLDITVLNNPPVADAGPDDNGSTSSAIPLDGTGSFDPDGDPITGYQWSVAAGPGGGFFGSPNNATTTFTTGTVGTYTIELEVTTVSGVATDTMDLTVTSLPPVANAGADATIGVGMSVTLDGSGSTDPENDPLSFNWSIASTPGGSMASIVNSTSQVATFTPDIEGDYLIDLTVTAAGGNDTDSIQVFAIPDSLIIVAGSTTGVTEDYRSTIVGFGFPTDIVLLDNVTTFDFTGYTAILVSDDVPNTWTAPQVQALTDRGVPVLGVGNGGAGFFAELGLAIGQPNTMSSSMEDAVIVRNSANSIWQAPNSFSALNGSTYQITGTVGSSRVWSNTNATADTVAIAGSSPNYEASHEMIVEMGPQRVVFFGFRSSPTAFTAQGINLLENLIHYLFAM